MMANTSPKIVIKESSKNQNKNHIERSFNGIRSLERKNNANNFRARDRILHGARISVIRAKVLLVY